MYVIITKDAIECIPKSQEDLFLRNIKIHAAAVNHPSNQDDPHVFTACYVGADGTINDVIVQKD